MESMREVSLCLILCLLLLACMAGCLTPSSPPEELTGHSWRLVSYNTGNEMADAGPLTTITLKFGEDGRISGNAGCNDYFGNYTIEGGLTGIGVQKTTKKNCPARGGVMETEQRYLLLLENTTRYSIDQDELTLSYYDVKKLLVFRSE
jgi:heat shock protein HslJ